MPSNAPAADIGQLIADAQVPGLSMAIIRKGSIETLTTPGVRNACDAAAVDEQTIFDAASLSKPVFAYAVLQLVDAGALALDMPLARHFPDYVPDDPRAGTITVRHVLSHSSGLLNWRTADLPPRFGPVLPMSAYGTQLRVGRSAGAGPFLRVEREQGVGTNGALFPSAHDPCQPSRYSEIAVQQWLRSPI